MLTRTLAAGVALGALMFAATGAYAQEITGGVAGHVTENGKAVGGAKVSVTNVGTGATTTATSDAGGFYTVRNLQPGGPYTVTVTAPDQASDTATIDQIGIGAPYSLDVMLASAVSSVTVTAAPVVRNAAIATGPRTTITAADIQQLPSFAGDLHDLVRLNPFVTIDEANSNAMTIAGTNNHFNTIYLDGVTQADNFGLNNNGYPTQRNPFSLEIVQAMNLEVAPYDVQYGDFEGGVVNVVTKSGSNQFHGSVSYNYDSSAESGKFVGPGARYSGVQGYAPSFVAPAAVTTVFRDQDSTATISGPLWKDHVFFFFGYDAYQGPGTSVFTPSDVAGANQVPGVASSDVNNVTAVLKASTGASGYGYDPLSYGGTAPLLNTDYFAKLDWYINDKQHVWFSWQSTEGSSYNTPDASITNKELNLASSDYILGQNLTAYTMDWTSHWTENLATEVEYTFRDVETPSKLVGGPFANFLVQNLVNPATGGEIDLGPDVSRQANQLGVKDQQARFRAHYTLGDNVITAGYEWEQTAEFDLFVQQATGSYTFNNTCGPGDGMVNGGLVNLQDHVACSFTYQNASTNNPNSAAGVAFNYTNTLYLEDEWHPLEGLTVTGGLRYEGYSTPNKPLLNPRFVAQYGFANNGTINGENVLMPRLGLNWKPNDQLTVTGGVGLFSGGNPGVYTYDSYDNPGDLLGKQTYTCNVANCALPGTGSTVPLSLYGSTAGTPVLIGVTGSSIPLAAQNDITHIAETGTGTANALDPHFKPPSQWKASISVQYQFDAHQFDKYLEGLGWFGDSWRAHADFLASKTVNGVLWQDIWAMQNQLTATEAGALGIASPDGNAPDGRPLFNPNRFTCGTINPATGACATLNPPGTPAGTVRTSGQDILLTNTHQGYGLVWALGLEKSFHWGLDVDYTYTGQQVKDVTGATSSVATSNYLSVSAADPNHPGLSTSPYQIAFENRLSVSYRHKWLGDNNTTIRFFMYNRAGLPLSYVFCPEASSVCSTGKYGATSPGSISSDLLFGQYETSTLHQLLYVPKADSSGSVTPTSDPRVTYAPGFNVTNFNDFLHSSGLIKYAGSISPRNAFRSSDVNTGDVQFAQEIPALFPNGAKGEVYMDIINVLNMLNRNWGVDTQVNFPYAFAPVSALNCQFSGLTLGGAVMPTCAAGRGNFYQYGIPSTNSPSGNVNGLRLPVSGTSNQFSQVQTLTNPPVPTWVLKFGIRYKF
jgi:carboxypeptidase family protein/TonB-dependent receptor-like protein